MMTETESTHQTQAQSRSDTSNPKPYNVAAALAARAERSPYQPAVVFPSGRDAKGRAQTVQLSYRQLNEACDRYAHGLSDLGIRQGERVLLLFKPGVAFITVVFALVKMGAVPVIIDPGMGTRAFLQCVREAEPVALIGLPVVHLLRRAIPGPFTTVRRTVTTGRLGWLADTALDPIGAQDRGAFPTAPTTGESEAAVAFTSGSTGIPKGVIYRHGMFGAQIELLKTVLGIHPGEVDLALLYIFALFNPALGVTTIIPDMDPTKSAEINPAYVVESIRTHGVTNAFGSPTIWKIVAPYCVERGIRLPSIKRIIMAGAPVPPGLIRTMKRHVLAEDARIVTPFGATEAMPLTYIEGREILAETAALTEEGRGMCVGRPLPGVEIRIIPITEAPIPTWDESLALPQGQIGEIVAKGPMVTRTYLNRPEKTARAKIRQGQDVWHRMGDLGYFDEDGRLWFCGRKAHRVETATGRLYPVLCETIFNRHPQAARTALVGVGEPGERTPVLVVEPHPGAFPDTVVDHQRFKMELLALGAEYKHTRPIHDVRFYPGTFPTDVRHNAKIQREKLAQWAASGRRIRGSNVSYVGPSKVKGARTGWGHLVALLGAVALAVLSIVLLNRRRSRDDAG
jgi:acyl-CoA synthetase (AMP-forming)/AMP-acid ligase II